VLVEEHGVWVGCCGGRKRSLAEVWAAGRYGVDEKRSNKELATWWRRLAYELGVLSPVDVAAPALGCDAPETVRRVWDGFLLLIGLRRTDGPGGPVAFAVRFAAAWCGTPKNATHRAIQSLTERGHMVVVSHAGRLPLYLPATVGDASDPSARSSRLSGEGPK
jgi:hypothetical protein